MSNLRSKGERIEEQQEFVKKILDHYNDLKDEVIDTYNELQQNTIKSDGRISLVAARAQEIEAHWGAVDEFKMFLEALVDIAGVIEESGDLKKCYESIHQMETSIKKYNPDSEEEN